MKTQSFPISYLFVPADKPKYVDKAPSRGADVVILDLEDSVPYVSKPAAREMLNEQLNKLVCQDQVAAVRVNAELLDLYQDLISIDLSKVAYLLLPKAEDASVIRWIDQFIEALEKQQNTPPDSTKLIPMIESCLGLANVRDIAKSCDRVCALALGSEDFANELGVRPTRESLQGVCQQIVLATSEAKISAIGFPGSIANINNLEMLNNDLTLAKSLGFSSALCIHPTQVEQVNKVFNYTTEQLNWATQVIEAMEKAEKENHGVVKLNGQMIDAPVVLLARKILKRSGELEEG